MDKLEEKVFQAYPVLLEVLVVVVQLDLKVLLEGSEFLVKMEEMVHLELMGVLVHPVKEDYLAKMDNL